MELLKAPMLHFFGLIEISLIKILFNKLRFH